MTIADVPAVLDPSVLEKLAALTRERRPGFVSELVAIYRREAAKALGQLDSAAAEDDLAGIQEAAHTLRGNSGSLGARALPRRCEALERLQPGTAKLAPALAAVRREHDRLLTALAGLLATLGD
jgi:HPt (histidine-containing phosphotransfer) domain-containing protein